MKPIGIPDGSGKSKLLTLTNRKPDFEQEELTLSTPQPTPQPTPPDGDNNSSGDNSTSTKAESSSNVVLNYMANGAVYNQLSIAKKKKPESQLRDTHKKMTKDNIDRNFG